MNKLEIERITQRYAIREFRVGSTARAKELGVILGKTPSSLNRMFQRLFGCSPSEYLRDLRRQYARTLKERRGLSGRKITRAAGYGTTRTYRRNAPRDLPR